MRTCAQCQGKLVLINQKTEMVEGNRTPVTSRTFRCLDDNCQRKIDKETLNRIKALEEKAKKA